MRLLWVKFFRERDPEGSLVLAGVEACDPSSPLRVSADTPLIREIHIILLANQSCKWHGSPKSQGFCLFCLDWTCPVCIETALDGKDTV